MEETKELLFDEIKNVEVEDVVVLEPSNATNLITKLGVGAGVLAVVGGVSYIVYKKIKNRKQEEFLTDGETVSKRRGFSIFKKNNENVDVFEEDDFEEDDE